MIASSALLSGDRRYRFELVRRWSEGGGRFVVIGLNPSKADETLDDQTIRRCIGFAKRAGCDELVMLNLFGYRATNPRELKKCCDPIGIVTDTVMMQACDLCHPPKPIVVAAWGTGGAWLNRGNAVRILLANQGVTLYHFGLTKDGHPKHPLHLASSTRLTRFLKGKRTKVAQEDKVHLAGVPDFGAA